MPGFPVYQRQGEMEVKIRCVKLIETISKEDMSLIKMFHCHIFYDILGMKRGEMVFRPEHSPMPLFVVPLYKSFNLKIFFNVINIFLVRNNGNIVDYALDRRHLNESIRNELIKPTNEERMKFKFDENTFFDTVVVPWYRPPPVSYYYVAEVCYL